MGLRVRPKSKGPIDDALDAGLSQQRHPDRGGKNLLVEAVEVGLEKLGTETLRHTVDAPDAILGFPSAHQKPVALSPHVEGGVATADRGEGVLARGDGRYRF